VERPGERLGVDGEGDDLSVGKLQLALLPRPRRDLEQEAGDGDADDPLAGGALRQNRLEEAGPLAAVVLAVVDPHGVGGLREGVRAASVVGGRYIPTPLLPHRRGGGQVLPAEKADKVKS